MEFWYKNSIFYNFKFQLEFQVLLRPTLVDCLDEGQE